MAITKASSNAVAPAAKGDLVAGTTTNDSGVLAVGANGTVLTAASGETTGLKWVAPAAFSAYLNGNQSITTNVATKIAYNAEDFDTNGCYDPTTNYRFTPTTAGYYQINVNAFVSTVTNTRTFVRLYKNGSNYVTLFDDIPSGVNSQYSGSVLVEMNGTSDYLEVYMFVTGTTINIQGTNSTQNKFSGVWTRGL